MQKGNFSAHELSEMEALQIRGGASGSQIDPMAQLRCANKATGCGSGVDQTDCVNEVLGCGSTVHMGSSCIPLQSDCLKPNNNC